MAQFSDEYWQTKLDQFRVDLDFAHARFNERLDAFSGDKETDMYIHLYNSLNHIIMDWAAAIEGMGDVGARDRTRQRIIAFFRENTKPIDLGVAGRRVAAVSAAYQADFRPSWAGEKDGRMVSALQFAAWYENGSTDGDFWQTIDKSIRRLRQKLRTTELMHLNEETLQIERSSPSQALFDDLPSGQGRPKMKPN